MAQILSSIFPESKPVTKTEIETMLTEACYLDEKVRRMTEHLRELKVKIAAHAVFEKGKTAAVAGRDVIAKVQLRFTKKYDQSGLENLRQTLSDEKFFKLFELAYIPKRNIETMAETLDVSLSDYCETKPAAPAVTFIGVTEGGPDVA